MAHPKYQIQNLGFDGDGDMHIAYLAPDEDVKEVGVVHLHTLLVPRGFDYDDEMDAVLDAIMYLIGDVLEDLPALKSAAAAEAEAALQGSRNDDD